MLVKQNQGFTLVEIMVTVAILGIGLSITFPALSGLLAEQRLYSTARQVAGEMRLVQQRAINGEGTAVKLQFNPNDNYYARLINLGMGDQFEKTFEVPQGIIILDASFGSDASTKLTFELSGAPVKAGTVTLQNSKQTKYLIHVLPATGRVRLQRVE